MICSVTVVIHAHVICSVTVVTHDHGYVPFVVITIRSFLYSCIITGFVTGVTSRYKMWNRNCLPFRSTWFHSRFLVRFVLLDLYFYCEMFCRSLFVLLIFFVWSLYCLSFLHLRLLISSTFHYSVVRQHEWFLIVRMQIKGVIVFNAPFNNISVISRNIVENHRSLASPWQILAHTVVSSTPRHALDSNSQL